MSYIDGTLPRDVHIKYVEGHNVLEVCGKDKGVRFVMAQDSETAKERDKYKLRAHMQPERIKELEAGIQAVAEKAQDSPPSEFWLALHNLIALLPTPPTTGEI